jgi:outer membrane murein-binding lipoprotein Lpp
MTDMKSGLKFVIAVALVSGTALVAGCGSSDKVTRTTTTEQSTTVPVAPMSSTTTTTSTQQTRP